MISSPALIAMQHTIVFGVETVVVSGKHWFAMPLISVDRPLFTMVDILYPQPFPILFWEPFSTRDNMIYPYIDWMELF